MIRWPSPLPWFLCAVLGLEVVGELISLSEQHTRESHYQLTGRINLFNEFIVGDHLNEFAIDQTKVSQSIRKHCGWPIAGRLTAALFNLLTTERASRAFIRTR